jgi:hypothetical protein
MYITVEIEHRSKAIARQYLDAIGRSNLIDDDKWLFPPSNETLKGLKRRTKV